MLAESDMTEILTVSETTESRKFWLSQDIVKDLEQQLAAADVLIVPLHEFRPGVKYVFHQDTPALYEYLKSKLADQIVVDICANDDEYLEIALHSNFFRLSQIVLSYAVVPVVFGLLTNYIYDELKAKPGDTVELSLIIEDEQCKAFNFSFKGDAKDLTLMADKVGQMARDCKHRAAGKRN
ncbi:hypothetical protein A7318_23195 [Pseudomonas lurida]|nr:hypothetical protein A7318_23195 [Pseudomonas lurida]